MLENSMILRQRKLEMKNMQKAIITRLNQVNLYQLSFSQISEALVANVQLEESSEEDTPEYMGRKHIHTCTTSSQKLSSKPVLPFIIRKVKHRRTCTSRASFEGPSDTDKYKYEVELVDDSIAAEGNLHSFRMELFFIESDGNLLEKDLWSVLFLMKTAKTAC
ncbi:hypothetical protein L210DRAFT_3503814 [Boletus edulis BED1]|uniref:Uncharacterized protein n=1 Tax=Boletus edulis BED1 TaxID=1328754 RepID=A0AAD4BVB6_BOLED|nr:hypothetical protein L210DRAFT_3503814 [Boletus edulis BED1]